VPRSVAGPGVAAGTAANVYVTKDPDDAPLLSKSSKPSLPVPCSVSVNRLDDSGDSLNPRLPTAACYPLIDGEA